MQTLIDALFVELGLDPSKFIKGSRDVDASVKKTSENARKTMQDVEDGARKSTQSLQKLQGQVLLLFTAFTAGHGLKDFIRDTVSMNAGLGRTAHTLDTTVQKLGTWINAGSAVGASAEDIVGAFQSMTSQFQQFALTGESDVIPYFRALGVNMANSNGQMRDMGDVFLDLHKKFIQMDPARAKAFADDMHIPPGMTNLLLQHTDALERLLAMGKKYAPTEADTKAATELYLAWNQMGLASSRAGRTFLTEVEPILLGLIKALTAIVDWLNDHPTALTFALGALTLAALALSTALTVNLAGTAFAAVFTGFRLLLGFLPNLMLGLAVMTETTLPGLAGAFLSTGIAIEAMLGPIGLAIAGMTALYYLYKSLPKDSASHRVVNGERGSKQTTWQSFLGLTPPAKKGARPVTDNIAADRAIDSVLQNEDRGLTGRVTNDSGGITKFGISSKANPGVDVANLTLDQARAIYKKKYWDAIGGDSLPAGIQQTALDAAINQGVGNASKWLKASGGDVAKFNELRREQYQYLARVNPAKYAKYLKGWLSRDGLGGTTPVVGPDAGAPQVAAATNITHGGSSSSVNSNETNIGTLNVNAPQARDVGSASAQGIKTAIGRNNIAQQANYGQG